MGFTHLFDQPAAKADNVKVYQYQKLICSALHFRKSFLGISYYVAAPHITPRPSSLSLEWDLLVH
jgi:hypothetical protein